MVMECETLRVATRAATAFVDLTDDLARIAASAGARRGLLHVHTRHTTTGIIINEHEPLLLDDIRDRLARWAPDSWAYGHDDLSRRTVNLSPDERRNGHAHCRAMLLRTSECVQVVDGRLALGRWQRVLLVELDGPRDREVMVMVIGHGERGMWRSG
jgi:secondary thiamine-phosphate synthase enzyme